MLRDRPREVETGVYEYAYYTPTSGGLSCACIENEAVSRDASMNGDDDSLTN
jgi:hypothetical protein